MKLDPKGLGLDTNPARQVLLHHDFDGPVDGTYQPDLGIPWMAVDDGTPDVIVTIRGDHDPTDAGAPDESDQGPTITNPRTPASSDGSVAGPARCPIPPDAPIEGGQDHHVLIVHRSRCLLYELWHASLDADGVNWHASALAIFELTNNPSANLLRPDSWTSADQAGLPIVPGLARREEVVRGSIRHALRVTMANTEASWIHPATHPGRRSYSATSVAGSNGPSLTPERFVRHQQLPPQSRTILEALKRYGMFVADTGGAWFLSGERDIETDPYHWDHDDLDNLARVTADDFEVVHISDRIHTLAAP